jgi:hypothetical protein
MRSTRLIAATVLMFSLALATPGVATAATTYPSPRPQATVSPSTVTPNRNVVFKAYGFKSSETIRVNQRYGTGKPGLVRVLRAGKGGTIAINLKFKYTGKVTVSARNASGRTVSAVVRVVKKG